MRAAARLLAALVVLAGLALPGLAVAHTRPAALAAVEPVAEMVGSQADAVGMLEQPEAAQAAPAAPSTAGPALAVVLLGLAGAAIGLDRSRRAIAVTVVMLLALLAFETGLHSVHHIGQADQTTTCPVASATPHLADANVAAATEIGAAPPTGQRPIDVEAHGVHVLVSRFDDGRAPPA